MPLIQKVYVIVLSSTYVVIPKLLSHYLFNFYKLFQACNNNIKKISSLMMLNLYHFVSVRLETFALVMTLGLLTFSWMTDPSVRLPSKRKRLRRAVCTIALTHSLPLAALRPGGSITKSVCLHVWKLLFLGSHSSLYRGGAKVRCLQRLSQKQFT